MKVIGQLANNLQSQTLSINSAGLEPTDFRLCQHCRQPIEPLRFDELGQPTTDPGNTVYSVMPRYCPCPDGQADEAAEDAEQARRDWLVSARQLIYKLDIGKYSEYRFGTWDIERNKPNSQQVYDAVRGYVLNVVDGKTNRWLYLSGPYGTGKTHLAIAAIRQIAAERLLAPYVSVWPQHCSDVQESWDWQKGEHAPTERKLWSDMRNAGVLLIDDIDKQRSTQWAMQKLYEVIDYRVVRDRATIITANHKIKQLRRIWLSSSQEHIKDTGSAILSRISGQLYSSVEFTGDDQRWK